MIHSKLFVFVLMNVFSLRIFHVFFKIVPNGDTFYS